jgi:hypothetical protein
VPARGALLALSLAALLSACGTTVPLEQQAEAPPGGSLSSGGTPGADAGPAGSVGSAGTGAPAGPTQTGASGAVAGRPTAGRSGSPTGNSGGLVAAGPRTPLPTAGPGWDRNFVYVGVTTQKDTKQIAETYGIKSVDNGDTEAQALAVAGRIDREGGVLGRKIKIVFRDMPTIDTATNPEAAGAQACTFFTQDRKVIAVINIVTLMDGPNFRACLAKAGVALFSASAYAIDDVAAGALAPSFYQSLGVSWDPLAPLLVKRLKAGGWFGGWDPVAGQSAPTPPRIGILVDGKDVGGRVATKLKSTLAAAGYKDVLTYSYGRESDGQQSSVIYFSGNRVTHLIVTNIEMGAFQIAAASQGYYPRYGITTYNAPFQFLEANAPPRQNRGSMGVGWAPTLDVSDQQDPRLRTPGVSRCEATMAAAKQGFTGRRLAHHWARIICDGLEVIRVGAVTSGGLKAADLERGVFGRKAAYSPAVGFSGALTPGKRFVAGSVRDLSWDEECGCMRYSGPDRAL